jgi:hypothetical protein
MRKRLQIALMSIPILATSFSLTSYVQAETGAASGITTTSENGRKVFVNDASSPVPARRAAGFSGPRRSSLVYWSSKERRWKAVSSANGATMKAARSAAAEVDQYLGQDSTQTPSPNPGTVNFIRGRMFTAEQIDAAITEAAARHNVDPNLVRSVVKVESNFNPNAVSRKGAMGLMQLMPGTARSLNVTNPFDPQQNVDAGVRHLKKLLESFGGDIKLSLPAYNAGAGAVTRSAGVPHFAETQNYVRRITSLYYGGTDTNSRIVGNPVLNPVRVQRDARGVLYISNTD